MAALNPLYVDLKAQGMEMLAVNVAQGRDRIEPFVADLKIVYPVLFDPDGGIARSYGVSALPVTWFIDREGRLRGKIVGESTPEIFLSRARELMGNDHGQ
jgi:peroxiredoxin